MNRRWRWTGLAAASALLLSSCSAMKLAYNRLDWLVSWEVGKYVDLEGPSKPLFKEGLASLWQWHRSTQLGSYARDLREIAEASQGTPTREQIAGYLQRAGGHGERLFLEALPPSSRVLQALDDEQIRGLLEKMGEDRQEQAEEDAERTPEKTREEYVRNASRTMRRWLGSMSDAQGVLVRDWAATRRDDPALWKRYGEHWAAAFERTLLTRAAPGFEMRLRDVFRDPQLPDSAAIRELTDYNREHYIDLLAQIAPTLSDAQRKHLRKRLIAIAEDLEELASQPQHAATPAPVG